MIFAWSTTADATVFFSSVLMQFTSTASGTFLLLGTNSTWGSTNFNKTEFTSQDTQGSTIGYTIAGSSTQSNVDSVTSGSTTFRLDEFNNLTLQGTSPFNTSQATTFSRGQTSNALPPTSTSSTNSSTHAADTITLVTSVQLSTISYVSRVSELVSSAYSFPTSTMDGASLTTTTASSTFSQVSTNTFSGSFPITTELTTGVVITGPHREYISAVYLDVTEWGWTPTAATNTSQQAISVQASSVGSSISISADSTTFAGSFVQVEFSAAPITFSVKVVTGESSSTSFLTSTEVTTQDTFLAVSSGVITNSTFTFEGNRTTTTTQSASIINETIATATASSTYLDTDDEEATSTFTITDTAYATTLETQFFGQLVNTTPVSLVGYGASGLPTGFTSMVGTSTENDASAVVTAAVGNIAFTGVTNQSTFQKTVLFTSASFQTYKELQNVSPSSGGTVLDARLPPGVWVYDSTGSTVFERVTANGVSFTFPITFGMFQRASFTSGSAAGAGVSAPLSIPSEYSSSDSSYSYFVRLSDKSVSVTRKEGTSSTTATGILSGITPRSWRDFVEGETSLAGGRQFDSRQQLAFRGDGVFDVTAVDGETTNSGSIGTTAPGSFSASTNSYDAKSLIPGFAVLGSGGQGFFVAPCRTDSL